jgi:hypothetical protein
MPAEIGDQRIGFHLEADDPFELDGLGEAFAGLARQYEKLLEQSGIEKGQAPAKLYVTRIRSGSLSFEIGTTLLAAYSAVQAIADNTVLFDNFYKRLKAYFEYFAGRAERPNDLTRADAEDYDSFLQTVSGKRGARLKIRRAYYRKETQRSRVVTAFEFDPTELATAGVRLASELGQSSDDELPKPDKNHRMERNVPFIWHRTDREKGKAKGATSDRGIIAKVSDKPLPVYFPSESDEAKQRMTKVKRNPFDLVYLVDVLVEYDDQDEPITYTVTDLRRIIND